MNVSAVSVAQIATYVLTLGISCILACVLVQSDQVQQGEQEYPDDIDEVPIQAADFDWRKIFGVERSTPGHHQDHQHQGHTNNHVQSVKPCHEKVKAE